MDHCPNCGIAIDEGSKFCRNCGSPLGGPDEEAKTWRLPPNTSPNPEVPRSTMPVWPGPDTMPPPDPSYNPPAVYYPQSYLAPYEQPPAPRHVAGQTHISLGDWLSGGWRVYKENWLLMSLATLFGGFLSVVTFGIMAGPLLMGLYRMAFKTLRQERPEMSDLFNWEGRFLQAFLAFLICAAIYGGVNGVGGGSALSTILSLVVTPLLTMVLGLALPLMLERRIDVAAAFNEVGRLIFSRDAFMWWLVGLVFSVIAGAGFFGFCVGFFVTLPWIISSAAVAYSDTFEFDDPNRTLH